MENTINLNDIHEAVYTQEDQQQLLELASKPIYFDEECPEITPEQAIKFRRVNPITHYAN